MKSLLYFVVAAICMAFIIPKKQEQVVAYSNYDNEPYEVHHFELDDIEKEIEQHTKAIDSIIDMVEKNNTYISHKTKSRQHN
jgi:hypothetical protein